MSNLAQTTIRPKNTGSLLLLFLACAALLLGVAGGASAFPPPGTASDLTLAWGDNPYGQCTVPPQAQSGIVAIAGGGYHSLALTSDGEVLAWGNNGSGQCAVPAQAQSGIVAIAAGGLHSLALTSDGEVLAWGNNGQGQSAVPPQAQSGIVAIAAGDYHSLALTSGGEVLAWGYNNYGQCTVPAQAQSGIVAIAAGWHYHTLALTSDGEVLAWGSNIEGQCTVPAQAQSGIVAIAGGYEHSLALTSGGQVLAWGFNGFGQCTVPAQAQSGIVAIAAGVWDSLALTSDGEVLAWGWNGYGQCTVPAQAQSGIFAIAAGLWHSLALHGADTVSVSLSPPSPATVASGGTTSLSASATDVWGHGLTWSWDDAAAGGLFSPPDSATPTYTAPANTTDSNATISLSATATCTEGASDTQTTTLTVQPVEHTFSVSANPPDPTPVPSGGSTALSVQSSDSRPAHSVASWSWDDGGAGGSFSPSATVQDPSYTAPANTTDSDLIVTLTVNATCDGPEPLGDSDSTTLTVEPVAHTFTVSANPASPSTVASGGSSSLSATFSDSRSAHAIASWSWDDGGAGGGFSPSAAVQDPTYTAAANTTDSNRIVTLTVNGTCDGPGPLGDDDSTSLTVQPVAHTLDVYASVDPVEVESGGSASLTANYTDSRTHTIVSWSWSDGGPGVNFSPSASVQNPTYTAPVNGTGMDLVMHLAVSATCDGSTPLVANDTVDLTVHALSWAMPKVVLEEHPNERGPGSSTPKVGLDPWTRTLGANVSTYWWHDYKFAASGVLWVQMCAQNWSAKQIGVGRDDDNTRVSINGVIPRDYDGVQTGPVGGYQWTGNLESGERWTLRFLRLGAPGVQIIRIAADEQPVLWWVKVTDLEPETIYPM